jgi:hypothetical protein
VFLASAGLLGFAVGRVIRSGGASNRGGNGANGSPPAGLAPPNVAMADATVSMQPVMPRGEPSSTNTGNGAPFAPEPR